MNKMRRSRTDMSEITSGNMKQSPGVYGKGGGPGFESYPQSAGSNTIVTKTAETGLGTAKTTVNELRRSASNTRFGVEGKQPSTSTMKTSKNKYRRSRTEKSEVK